MDIAMQDSPVPDDNMVNIDNLRASILGPKTQYVSEGSTVALQCRFSSDVVVLNIYCKLRLCQACHAILTATAL